MKKRENHQLISMYYYIKIRVTTKSEKPNPISKSPNSGSSPLYYSTKRAPLVIDPDKSHQSQTELDSSPSKLELHFSSPLLSLFSENALLLLHSIQQQQSTVMLRSLSFFSLFKPTRFPSSLHFLSSVPLSSPLKLAVSTRGSISEVIQILGPINLLFPNTEVCLYIRLLKKCIRSDDSFKGSLVHAHVLKSGFKSDLVVCNVLLDMYAKSGRFVVCKKLFDELPQRDSVTFCTLISGFSNYGFHEEAFYLFKSMFHTNLKPNNFVLSSILKACANSGILILVLMVHSLVIKSGQGFDPFIEIGFVNSYSKCGNLTYARKLFDEIPIKSTVAWNAIISGYVQNGFFLESLNIFKQMYKIGFIMDVITLRIVAFCASTLGLLQLCKNIHVYAIKLKLSHDNYFVSELIKVLKNSNEIEYLKNIFNQVRKPFPSLHSSVISALNSNNFREDSLVLLKNLLSSKPDLKEGDFVNLLNLCLIKKEALQIHCLALKTAHFSYISVGNALISLYFNLGDIKEAYRTFQKVPNQDLVSWTAVLTGLVQSNEFQKSIEIFNSFRRRSGLKLDEYCLSTALNACALNGDLKPGIQIHALGLKSGFQFSDFVTVSLIDMYSKCGQIGDFVKLYSDWKYNKNEVLINVVINGFCDNFYPQNALELFMKEYKLGFVPDGFSYSVILKACTDLKARVIGDQIQSRVLKSGYGNSDLILGNSLINFFIKCGCVLSARKIFNEMKLKNENSYALLMLGYLKNGNNTEILRLFSEMQQNGILGNYVIFNRILRGCADVAALDLGKQVHASIIKIGLIKDVYIEKALVGLYAKSDFYDDKESKDFKSVGVFMVEGEIEKESLDNYENAPDLLGRNKNPLIDLLNFGGNNKKEKGGFEEEFLRFEISDQVFLVGNLGFLKRKQSMNLGFV